MMRTSSRVLAALLASAVVLAGCGGDEGSSGSAPTGDRPTVVVTTNILGDVVENLVGDELRVITIMPVGSDPDEDGHQGVDPHFFTDPARMALAADRIVAFLIANVDGVDATALQTNAASYIAQLESVDAEVETILLAIPSDRRVLVTNHEVFGYFADRYGFEVAGTIIPGGSTADGSNAQALAELAELIEHEGVPAIFADTSSSGELAVTLAGEVDDIGVVELFSESLGSDGSDGATYLDMIRSNAKRIANALSS
jgi:zinc/manganese transport system substrate-binding protein